MKTGNANYGKGGYKKKNHFKLKDGDSIFRILPPLGNLAEKGVWSRYYSAHFGYKNSEGKLRPFESPLETKYDKETKTKTVVVADAALDRLNDLKAKLEKAKAEGNGPLVAKLNTLVGFKGIYSIDNNHHMNVMALDGSIGELKIRHKAKLALDIEIEKLLKDNVDPLALENGRFFVFSRSGSGTDTGFKVSVYTEKLDVPGVGKVDRQVVSNVGQEIQARFADEAFDLDSIFAQPTAEEVKQIVAESDLLSGKSPAVDRLIDAKYKAKRNANQSLQDDDGPADDYVAPTSTAKVTPLQTTQTAAPVQNANTAAIVKPLNGATATVVTPAALVTPTAAVAKAPAQSVEELSDDDFFKMIENQQ